MVIELFVLSFDPSRKLCLTPFLLAVVVTLDHVLWHINEVETGQAGHGRLNVFLISSILAGNCV